MFPRQRPDAEERLAEAERHVAAAEARIARQSDLVARLDIGGRDTTEALRLLRRMEAALDGMRERRQRIERGLSEARSPRT